MGPTTRDLYTLLSQQYDKISKLTMQLEASLSRNSHLHARLLSTLDTLDYVQSELELERRRKDDEIDTKRTWKEKIKDLEAERDEMKEVVAILFKKVESYTGDYRDWPRAQMYLPDPVDHSTSLWHNLPEPRPTPVVEEALVQTLVAEQKAHASTLEALTFAENQIQILNAKVARREAELESCNFLFASKPLASSGQQNPSRVSNPAKISQQDALGALEATIQRNRALEQEIKMLSERLSRSRNFHSDHVENSIRNSPGSTALPTGGSTSAPSHSPQIPSSSPANDGPTCPINLQTGSLTFAVPATTEAQTKSESISDLANLIGTFAREVDKFQEERALLTESTVTASGRIKGEQPGADKECAGEEPIHFERVLMIEEECIRLTRLKTSMDDELLQLRDENSRLRAALNTASQPNILEPPRINPDQTYNSTSASVRSSPSFNISEGERDMDISETPLYSTYHLPTMYEHEDETDSLAGFMFLSFGPPTSAIDRNSSTNVEPSSGTMQDPISCETNSEGQDTELRQHSAPTREPLVLADTDEGTTTHVAPLSPAQIPLPISPEPTLPSTNAQARLVGVEQELELARRELAIKDAQIKETRDWMENLMKSAG